MDLTPHVTAVEDSLAAAAAAGDENTARTAAALGAALEPATRLAIMNALSELALEVTSALDDRIVELRLEPGEVRVVVSSMPADDVDEQDSSAETAEAGGETSRITLRLPESLKAQAEQAAEAAGVSLNTWLTRSVQESLVGRRRPGAQHTGHRVRGWVHG
jgi:HicB-like protein involved in pilus formation